MTIRLIEGLHLTATQKRHLADIIGKGWHEGRSGRIAYSVEPVEGSGVLSMADAVPVPART